MKYDDDYMKMMVDIIDLIPEIEKDCPEVKKSDTFLILCEMREELIGALQGQTQEMNDQKAMYDIYSVFGKKDSKDN